MMYSFARQKLHSVRGHGRNSGRLNWQMSALSAKTITNRAVSVKPRYNALRNSQSVQLQDADHGEFCQQVSVAQPYVSDQRFTSALLGCTILRAARCCCPGESKLNKM
jgi:hypothetical protein